MRITEGDIVRIIAPFPDGCAEYVFNKIGAVTEVNGAYYKVKVDEFNTHRYNADQIVLAKPYEMADALRKKLNVAVEQ